MFSFFLFSIVCVFIWWLIVGYSVGCLFLVLIVVTLLFVLWLSKWFVLILLGWFFLYWLLVFR